MFKINTNDKTIHITRGDAAQLTINFIPPTEGTYVLGPNTTVALSVYEANNFENLLFSFSEQSSTSSNTITLHIIPSDTKDNIPFANTPTVCWYEIEINDGEEDEKTVVGYDIAGPKLFIVYPEGE